MAGEVPSNKDEQSKSVRVIVWWRDPWVRKLTETILVCSAIVLIQVLNANKVDEDEWMRSGQTIVAYLLGRHGIGRPAE